MPKEITIHVDVPSNEREERDRHVKHETNDGDAPLKEDEEKSGGRKHVIKFHSSVIHSLNNSAVRAHVRSLAESLDDHNEIRVDESRIQRAVRDAGEYSYGVVAVELWVLDEQSGRLVRPAGGWWRRPTYESSDALRCLEDPSHPEFVTCEPVIPGVDIVGELWAEAFLEHPNLPRITSNQKLKKSLTTSTGAGSVRSHPLHFHNRHSIIVWRCMHSLLEDPDTAKSPRLKLLIDAGFGLAAAVPFNVRGHKGMVLYLARSNASTSKLNRHENQVYMNEAAQYVGSASAMTMSRRASTATKMKERNVACAKFRNNLVTKQREGLIKGINAITTTTNNNGEKRLENGMCTEFWIKVTEKIQSWAKKCLGGNLQPSPALSWIQTIWTWIGCFSGLIILSAMNEIATETTGGDLYLLLGPFGALMTLQYGLTAAPASQPRNAILGQAIAGAISIGFTYIPESILSTWVRRAVGPAFGIATMVKLGIPHPPAGAHSVLYASGDYNWMFYLLVVLGSIISVLPATMINNMSSQRQYPTHWGYAHVFLSKHLCPRTKGGMDEKKESAQS